MSDCSICRKPKQPPERAGSITGYIFRHKFCLCDETRRLEDGAADAVASWQPDICPKCLKQKVINQKAGSITSYLFQHLRCQCPAAVETNRKTAAQRKKLALDDQHKFPSAAENSLAVGDIIGGNYRILERIGRGGMGIVLRAVHVTIGNEYAVKVLAPSLIDEQTWLRFQKEARTMAALSHPSFAKVYDLGLHNSSLPFYAMDLVAGRSLEEVIIQRGSLLVKETIEIFLPVLDGLAYAHRHGIVHRDLKPSNIMLCSRDRQTQPNECTAVKLLDFGIAKHTSKESQAEQSLTKLGEVFGSPCYMSPEHSSGRPVDQRSDIYSIGCCLFETLTGYVPFEGSSAAAVGYLHQTAEPPRLSQVAPDKIFSDDLEFVVAKCLAKLPQNRYQTAKELAIDLERIAAGKDLKAYGRLPQSIEPASTPGPTLNTSTKIAMALAGLTIIGLSILIIFLPQSSLLGPSAPSPGAAQNGYRPPIKRPMATTMRIIQPGLGTISFPSESAVAELVVDHPPKTYSLQGEVSLPLGQDYELRPYSTDPAYLEGLRNLQITALSINDAQLNKYASRYTEYSPQSDQGKNTAEMASFLQKAAQIFPIHRIKIAPSIMDYRGAFSQFRKLDSFSIARPETDHILNSADIAFLSPRLKRLDLIEVENLDAIWLPFKEAKQITKLQIDTSRISDEAVKQILCLPALKTLNIGVPDISRENLVKLLASPALQRLKINYTPDRLKLIEEAVKRGCRLSYIGLYGVRKPGQLNNEIRAMQSPSLNIETHTNELFGL